MNYYSLKKPCADCPFLKVGGIRLRPGRAWEIGRAATDRHGARFTCHKTTVEGDEDDGEMVDGPNAQQCAGAMLFALKQETLNQGMRIAERLNLWQPTEMTGHELVFDDFNELWAANAKALGEERAAAKPAATPKPSYQVLKAELKQKLFSKRPMKETPPPLTANFASRVGREVFGKISQSLQVKRGPQPTKPTIWDLFAKAERQELERAMGQEPTAYTGPIIRRRRTA